ncbi:unnamed protein product [Rotaria sp. Silwood1]|nr:unnamed protein product [Rotaria sp. Silwood1]
MEKTIVEAERIIKDGDMDTDSLSDSDYHDDIQVLNDNKVKQQRKPLAVTGETKKARNNPSSTLTSTTTPSTAITTDSVIKTQQKPKTTSKAVKRNRSPNSSLDSTTTGSKELKTNINED